MPGLKGLSRLPRDTQRARRNATKLATDAASLFAAPLTVGGDGLITITLADDGGLEVVADALQLDLASTPGLELDSGLKVLVQGVLAIDGSGVKLVFADGLVDDSGTLKLDYDTAYLAISTNKLTFASPITANITTTADVVLDSDTGCVALGDGQDASICYDGTDLVVDSGSVAPSDLVVDCGAAKTLELAEPVWDDINMAGVVLAEVPAFGPGRDEFVDSTGTDTGISTFAIAVTEGLDGSFEIAHDYAEGTDIIFHVHWQGIAAPTGTDNVRWQLTYTIADAEQVLAAATTIAIETAFDAQYEFKRSDFSAISGTNIKIGQQFLFRLERIAAVGDAYAGDALVATVGIHYQVNTMGSRTVSTK